MRDTVNKFGFDHVCLCRLKSYEADAQESKVFLRVSSDTGDTILERESDTMTVADILQRTLKRRALRYGEYVLELKGTN